MDTIPFFELLVRDKILRLIGENVLLTQEIREQQISQNDVIDANWDIIHDQLDALEYHFGEDVFNKSNFKYLLGAVISHLSYRCNEDNVAKGTSAFVVRICEMFSRNADPSEYNFDSFVF